MLRFFFSFHDVSLTTFPLFGKDTDAEPAEGSRFRFGVFRASRERSSKKACPNKAARNAKCNSGDSGVQVLYIRPLDANAHRG